MHRFFGPKHPSVSFWNASPALLPEHHSTAIVRIRTPESITPRIDPNVPTAVCCEVRAGAPRSSLPDVTLAPLPPVSDPSFERILGAKVELCAHYFGFASLESEAAGLAKARAFVELTELFRNQSDIVRLNSKVQRAIFLTLTRSVLHAEPTNLRASTSDYSLPVVDPSWLHLSRCYELLTHFLHTFPGAEFVNFYVLRRFIAITPLPDANERLAIAKFIQGYYDIREAERLRILHAIGHQLVMFREADLAPFCVSPLLSCPRHVINTSLSALEDNIKNIVLRAVVPLVGAHYLGLYYAELKSFLMDSIPLLKDLKWSIVRQFQRLWPLSAPAKEHYYADILIGVVLLLDGNQFVVLREGFLNFIGNLCRPGIAS